MTLIEKVAKAIHEDDGSRKWEAEHPDTRQWYKNLAEPAIAAVLKDLCDGGDCSRGSLRDYARRNGVSLDD